MSHDRRDGSSDVTNGLSFHHRRFGIGICVGLMLIVSTLLMVSNRPVVAEKPRASTPPVTTADQAPTMRHAERVTNVTDITSTPAPLWMPYQSGTDGVGCAQELVTYSTHNFTNPGATIIQAGFVETEIFAASYTIDPVNFPVRIDYAEALFAAGQTPLCGQVTTQWSMLVWEGDPNTGNLICIIDCTISSDGEIVPHMIISPPTQGILVQAAVDPGDPDQIIVQNNGSNRFSVGFRIDDHNQEPGSTCQCIPGCGACGSLPAVCCPPTPNCNLFPTTDATAQGQAPNFPTRNWLWARPCPGATGLCAVQSGWHQTGSIGISGDWNIRVAFTPSDCVEPVGSCCVAGGTQCFDNLTAAECAAQSGTYQGDNTSCAGNPCPIQTGRCCLPGGACAILSVVDCAAQNGTYLGNGGSCTTGICSGACCVPATQQCVFTSQVNCQAAGGVFSGIGTPCSGTCFGACCLPDGSCVQATNSSACTTQGGTYQGGGTSCVTANCPQPVGACCVGTSCLGDLSENDCEIGFGGTWLGANSQCGFNPCDPLGACCLGSTCLSDVAQSDCTVGFGGIWQGTGSTCSPTNPCVANPCPADLVVNGVVGTADLLLLINSWGQCPAPPTACPADLAVNGTVGTADLLLLINAWGPCD